MTAKRININANRFSCLSEFYDEIENQFTRNLDWKIGRNLNAFNDVLRGGFGVHEYEEPIEIIWSDSDKSKKEFGYKATVEYLKQTLKICHPSNRKDIQAEIALAMKGQGETLFDIITDIIKAHEHIILKLN